MGCGGSKEEVAAGNTASFGRMLTRKSDPSQTKTTQDFSATFPEPDAKPEAEKPETADKPNDAPVAALKGDGVELKTEEKAVEVEKKEDEVVVEEGKEITKESPDRYFSSRKDEGMVEEVVAPKEGGGGEGLEYYSPLPEANNVREKVEEVEEKKEKKENDGAQEEPLKEEIFEKVEDLRKEEEELKEKKELLVPDAEFAASNEENVEQDPAEAISVEEAKPKEIVKEQKDSTEEKTETNSLAD